MPDRPVAVVLVDFENAFEWQALYIDGAFIREDTWLWSDVLQELERRGLLTFDHQMLTQEAAKRFLGTDRGKPLAAFAEMEVSILREQAAKLRLEADAIESGIGAIGESDA